MLAFLGYSWSGYRAAHPTVDTFRLGDTQSIEITLVREDERNLACASDVIQHDLGCGFDASKRPRSIDESRTLRPYNTVKGQLFLGAGLWSSLGRSGALPPARFTAVCDFHVTSMLRSALLRWAPNGSFDPLDRTVAVGALSNCVIPL
ncbi:MAG: hypothetical protein QM756_41675 [Polyangiaceae bacterium]